MKQQSTKRLYLVLGVAVYLLFLILYLNRSYPMVGHDYLYFLSNMLDSYIHYLENGLAVHWFTPSFGGGLPAFPNPQNIQFSLNQLLVFLVNPWCANLVSISIYTMFGYYACYRLGRDILQLGWMASSLGALFFMTTGFYIQHNAVGHVGYQVFPLICTISYLIFSPRWTSWRRGVFIGVLIAIFIYGAGFYMIVMLGLSLLLVIPLVYLLKSDWFDLKGVLVVSSLGGATALLLSIGKLYAILRFMLHFPRVISDHYYSNFLESLIAFIMQLIGVPLFTLPYRLLNDDPTAVVSMMKEMIAGGKYGIWEKDVSISPVLIFILVFSLRKVPGLIREMVNGRTLKQKLTGDRIIAASALVLGVWFVFEFISVRGVFYDLIRGLPIISSLHVNIRFTAAFVLPLAMLGAHIFEQEISVMKPTKQLKIFTFSFLVTLLGLGVYFLIPSEVQNRNDHLQQILIDYQNIRNGGEYYVAEILEIADQEVFRNHASSLYPDETIFGYRLEEFSTQLEPGSIYQEKNGYLNMTNPTSLVYSPDKPFTRFRINQRDMLEEFAQYQQPDWSIPKNQLVLNAISGVAFLVILGYGVFLLVRRLYLSSGKRF